MRVERSAVRVEAESRGAAVSGRARVSGQPETASIRPATRAVCSSACSSFGRGRRAFPAPSRRCTRAPRAALWRYGSGRRAPGRARGPCRRALADAGRRRPPRRRPGPARPGHRLVRPGRGAAETGDQRGAGGQRCRGTSVQEPVFGGLGVVEWPMSSRTTSTTGKPTASARSAAAVSRARRTTPSTRGVEGDALQGGAPGVALAGADRAPPVGEHQGAAGHRVRRAQGRIWPLGPVRDDRDEPVAQQRAAEPQRRAERVRRPGRRLSRCAGASWA